MKIPNETYDEALSCGLSRREAGYVAIASDLTDFFGELKTRQAEFLRQSGITMIEARNLDEAGRKELNDRWHEWDRANQSL